MVEAILYERLDAENLASAQRWAVLASAGAKDEAGQSPEPPPAPEEARRLFAEALVAPIERSAPMPTEQRELLTVLGLPT